MQFLPALTVLVLLAACAQAAVVPAAPTTDPAHAPAAPSAAPSAAKAVDAPAVPVEPAAAKPAGTTAPPPLPPPAAILDTPKMAPATGGGDAADKKMAPLMAAPAVPAPLKATNSSKGTMGTMGTIGTIGFEVLPPLLPKCSSDDECVQRVGKHSACRDYWCECVDGAQYDGGFSKSCLLSRTGVGESCKENGDCRVPNSYCKAGRCHCKAGFVFSDDSSKCLEVATVANPSCAEARQCVIMLGSPAGPDGQDGPAVCVDGACRCRYDHEHVNGTCVLKQARGKPCSTDVECEGLVDGECIQGVCGCKTGYVPAGAANKCLSVLHSLSATCEEDIQCAEGLGDLARCSAGRCVCVDGALLAEDKKCACAADEEFNKASTRCEKAMPGKQQAVKEQQQSGKGGADSLQSSVTVVAVLTCAVVNILAL